MWFLPVTTLNGVQTNENIKNMDLNPLKNLVKESIETMLV